MISENKGALIAWIDDCPWSTAAKKLLTANKVEPLKMVQLVKDSENHKIIQKVYKQRLFPYIFVKDKNIGDYDMVIEKAK